MVLEGTKQHNNPLAEELKVNEEPSPGGVVIATLETGALAETEFELQSRIQAFWAS
jgi:hypothetical protein